jgi:hypothetical protein
MSAGFGKDQIPGVPSWERVKQLKEAVARYPKSDWSEGSYNDILGKPLMPSVKNTALLVVTTDIENHYEKTNNTLGVAPYL